MRLLRWTRVEDKQSQVRNVSAKMVGHVIETVGARLLQWTRVEGEQSQVKNVSVKIIIL